MALDWLVYIPLAFAAAAAAVWGYLNFGANLGASLSHRLPIDDSEPGSPGPAPPRVALLVPGRNEAAHLPDTLRGLCEQDYGENLRVLFVDDCSTDASPEIARRYAEHYGGRLAVIRNRIEPPPGWVGKCWAVHQGLRHLVTQLEDPDAPTPWLCFTDADIHWDPRLLRTAMRYAREQDADVLTVCPKLRFGSAAEAVVQLQLMLALGILFPFEKAMDPKSHVAIAAGAFILVKRELYDRVGGHEAVKGEVVEDLMIGRKFKEAGATMRIALAGDLQWCRMYDGLGDMWEGLTKNAFAGLGYSPVKAVALLLATLTLNVLPLPLTLAALPWAILQPSAWSVGTLALAWSASMLQVRALNAVRRLTDLPWWYAWTMPLGNLAYCAIVLGSMKHAYFGGNVWKGRRYQPT